MGISDQTGGRAGQTVSAPAFRSHPANALSRQAGEGMNKDLHLKEQVLHLSPGPTIHYLHKWEYIFSNLFFSYL